MRSRDLLGTSLPPGWPRRVPLRVAQQDKRGEAVATGSPLGRRTACLATCNVTTRYPYARAMTHPSSRSPAFRGSEHHQAFGTGLHRYAGEPGSLTRRTAASGTGMGCPGARAAPVALMPAADRAAVSRRRAAVRRLLLRLRRGHRPHRPVDRPQHPQAPPDPAGLRRDPRTPQAVRARVAAGTTPHPGARHHPRSHRAEA